MPNVTAFLAIAVLLVVTPGPDMALVTRNAIIGGRRAALLTAIGVEAGLFVWTAASAAGLATLLETSASAFTLVKRAGAAYLVYLGGRTLLSLRKHSMNSNAQPRPIRLAASGRSPFQQGLLSNLLNPK